MLPYPIEKIELAIVQNLIENEIAESRTLDYKRQLSLDSAPDKKEFLKDVSAFANSAGGDIIYGVEEKKDAKGNNTGLPGNIVPMLGINTDKLNQQISSVILNGISPRIRFAVKEIQVLDGGILILLRIFESFQQPHMVTSDGDNRFYARSTVGRFPMDAIQIRESVLASENQATRLKDFRNERVSLIQSGKIAAYHSVGPTIILHIVPVSSFLRNARVLSTIEYRVRPLFVPMIFAGTDTRFNVDGMYSYTSRKHGEEASGYCQLFFNGAVESVGNGFVSPGYAEIPSRHIAELIFRQSKSIFQGLKSLNVDGPFMVALTLLACGNYKLGVGHSLRYQGGHGIDRDNLPVPELLIESVEDEDIVTTLRPLLDGFWNACGFERCFDYDDAGKYSPRR